MKKQYLVAGVIIALILGVGGYKVWEMKNPQAVAAMTEQSVSAEPSNTGNSNTSTSTSSSTSSSTSTPSTTVKTEAPINGTYKGVIEVGASGFNAFVANIDKDKNWELVTKEFGASLAYEGFANTSDVYEQMKKYITIITDKGVAGRNIHFVISSGALKNPKTDLIAKAITEKGFVVNKVTAEQEGKYALKALLPKNYRDNSFTVDIGSGNTKVSWYSNGNITSVEGYGAKYYQDGRKDPEVYESIKQLIQKVPQSNRQNVFIIGGVPFKLAKETRNGDERFTFLKNPDEYSAGDDVKVKSGLNIYRAIYENAGTTNVIFDWDANFTIGFLLTLN